MTSCTCWHCGPVVQCPATPTCLAHLTGCLLHQSLLLPWSGMLGCLKGCCRCCNHFCTSSSRRRRRGPGILAEARRQCLGPGYGMPRQGCVCGFVAHSDAYIVQL